MTPSRTLAAAALALATVAHAGPPALTTESVGFVSDAIFLTHAPNDASRLFVVQRGGEISIIKDGTLLATPFLDISTRVDTTFEGGLLGMAFHPGYEKNGLFYLNYTRTNGGSLTTVIAGFTVSANPDVADAGSAVTVIEVDQSAANHNGGWIGFGPNDGYLYIPLGDGGFGGPGSGGSRAQDLTDQLLGKVLRLDVNGDDFPADAMRNYAIPPTNPFVGITGDDEIWAYGLRNPWRASFDRETGDLWIGDVGAGSREEIDFQPAASAGGENYAWACMEGFICDSNSQCTCPSPTLTLPIHDYAHTLGCAVTGGAVYRGCAIPGLEGTYFFADYCSDMIWSLRYDGSTVSDFQDRTAELDPPDGILRDIVCFGEDALGELYVVSLTGTIHKIIPAVPPTDDPCAEPACAADITGPGGGPDGVVDALDLLRLISQWGSPCNGACDADITGPVAGTPDGNVDALDYLLMISQWGADCS
jgi:glucose/arabinose dehydrogenase